MQFSLTACLFQSLTLSKGLVGGQCFVLSNDHTPTVNRTLSVLNEEMTSDQLEAVGGTQASDFCSGLTIVPVQHFHKSTLPPICLPPPLTQKTMVMLQITETEDKKSNHQQHQLATILTLDQ